jgi:hypothetical protein
MGGAAYPDDWGGWLHEGRNPNSRVHPQGVGSDGVAAGIHAEDFAASVRRPGGLIAVPLDPLLAIFSVAEKKRRKKVADRLDSPTAS